ncbi:threonine/serine exporter family protein [Brochothrix campestris]|uniref:Threonine/Serine exporter ThrE domain-containing protein n=1 Tax=Brochothrix campestris FSL F6-1037 TaxID=1265861 RepID=W7D1A6_9LIST|nr:threonine/serine exporter family protein [Brochothrix campestris]EUJ39093.1 hypothetical protein BCAMP_08070 [Brochothrix campestris FSL F6-1037]
MLTYLLHIAICFVSVATFGVLLNVPARAFIACGVIGAVCWAVFEAFTFMGIGKIMATLIASFAVAIASDRMARKMKMPMIIFNMPGIVPLVPGFIAMSAVREYVNGDYIAAISHTVHVGMVAGAIAIGLMLSEVFNTNIRRFIVRREG